MLTARRADFASQVLNLSVKRGFGWRGRARTFNPLIQSQVPYHWATRQRGDRQDTRFRRQVARPIRLPLRHLPRRGSSRTRPNIRS